MPIHGRIGLGILVVFMLTALLGGVLSPYNPVQADYSAIYSPPDGDHIMGTDHLGRDLFSRLLAGTRTTLGLAFLVAFGNIGIALVLGAVSGFVGRWPDALLMRIVDAMIALPNFLLAVCFLGILGGGTGYLVLFLVLTGWAQVARIVRNELSIVKNLDFITANTAAGYSRTRNMFFHALPGVLPQLLVVFVTVFIGDIFSIVSLSFLGLGVSPQTPEWGVILADARDTFLTTPWLLIYPTLFIGVVSMGLHLTADGFRDMLDTKRTIFKVEEVAVMVGGGDIR